MSDYTHLTIFTPYLKELIAICQVIMSHVDVAALLIVIARVVGAARHSRSLLGVRPHEVDVRVRLDLCLLQRGELWAVQPQSLVGGEGATHLQTVPSTPYSMLASGFTGTLTGFSAVCNSNTMNKQVRFSWKQWIRRGHARVCLTCLRCALWTSWTPGLL